jgi:hypothetical protein
MQRLNLTLIRIGFISNQNRKSSNDAWVNYREKGRKKYRLHMVSKKHIRLCNKETKRNES